MKKRPSHGLGPTDPPNWMRVKRVKGDSRRKIVNMKSLRAIFKGRYKLLEVQPGILMVVGTHLAKGYRPEFLNDEEFATFSRAHEKLLAVRFNEEKNSFDGLICCGLTVKKNHIWLHTLRSAGPQKSEEARRNVKEYYFRPLLAPAVAFAREHGVSEIRLKAKEGEDSDRLVKFYKRMGFVFEDPKNPLHGVFRF